MSERAYEKYIGDILGLNQETDDLDTPPKVNTKKLYSLLKHSKQDSRGISIGLDSYSRQIFIYLDPILIYISL